LCDVNREGGRAEEGLLGGMFEKRDNLCGCSPGGASDEVGQVQGRGKAEEVGGEGGRGGRGGRGKGAREPSEGVAKDLTSTSVVR